MREKNVNKGKAFTNTQHPYLQNGWNFEKFQDFIEITLPIPLTDVSHLVDVLQPWLGQSHSDLVRLGRARPVPARRRRRRLQSNVLGVEAEIQIGLVLLRPVLGVEESVVVQELGLVGVASLTKEEGAIKEEKRIVD